MCNGIGYKDTYNGAMVSCPVLICVPKKKKTEKGKIFYRSSDISWNGKKTLVSH